MPRVQEISIFLIGFENHKARSDVSNPSGFWLRVNSEDAAPFIAAFKTPGIFHEFRIEHRIGRETRTSILSAQIVKIEEGPSESRVLIRPEIPLPLT